MCMIGGLWFLTPPPFNYTFRLFILARHSSTISVSRNSLPSCLPEGKCGKGRRKTMPA